MPTGARVSKYLKLPLALLAALAMLLLWSAPAGADPLDLPAPLQDLGTAVTEVVPPPTTDQPPAVEDVEPAAPPSAEAADVVTDALETAQQTAETVPTPTVPDVPVGGDLLGGEDAEGGEGTGTPEPTEALDPATLAEECQTALDEAGLPGGDACAAVVACFDLLPTPELGLTPEDLMALDHAQLEQLLDPAALEELFSPEALTSFLACLGSALGLPPLEPPTGNPGGGIVTSPAAEETYYANCDDARARGAAPVLAGQPGYRAGLDSDDDGVGCEDAEGTIQAVTLQTPVATAGKLAYTGFELTSALATGAALLALGGTVLLAARRRS